MFETYNVLLFDKDDKPKGIAEAKGDVKSKLAKPIQDLITTIFDVEKMKKCMLEFEVCVFIINNEIKNYFPW